MEAAIVMSACGNRNNSFGIRVEKREDGDWYRTWAFKLRATSAKREGYDATPVQGSLHYVEGYPGCPYCRSTGFCVCGECGKMFCSGKLEEDYVVCPWCENRLKVELSDSFKIKTGAF